MASRKTRKSRKRPTKKRPQLSGRRLSKSERTQIRELLAEAARLLHSIHDDLEDKTLTPRERADLRFNVREVEVFVTRSTGGELFARNRRWSLLHELTKTARDEGRRLTTQELAHLPRQFTGSAPDAVAARELLAKAVAARSRHEWLQLLIDAIAEVDVDAMGDHQWFPDAFETTILAHRREALRVLGISDVRDVRPPSPTKKAKKK